MSFFISHNPLCRNCCVLDRISHVINVTNSNESEYEKYLEMTEYEASLIIEPWLKDFEPCTNCGAKNIFPTNIEIGNEKLYDFNKLIEEQKKIGFFANLLILDLQNNYGEVELKVAGKQKNDSDFILDCMVGFAGVMEKIPESKFIPNRTDGNFQIVISGVFENGEHKLRVQKLINYGFSSTDIRNHILKYFMTYEL